MKKLIIMMIGIFIVMSTSVFAVSFNPIKTEEITLEDKAYKINTYEVDLENDDIFKTGLLREFEEDGEKYKIDSIEQSGGDLSVHKKESQYKVIETDTDNITEILTQLPETIFYNENEFSGDLKLNRNTINITKVADGTYKTNYTVSEDVSFSNYAANDLYNIPKFKSKNGVQMKLINVDWKVQMSEYVAGGSVPVLYSGVSHYKGIGTRTVTTPAKYSVTAEYVGEVVKADIRPITYKVTYLQENKEFNIIPVLGVALLLVGGIAYLLLRNDVQIYNLQEHEYVLIGSKRISYFNPILNIRGLSKKTMSNMYRFVISKRATKHLYGKQIKIIGKNSEVQRVVEKYNEQFVIEAVV